MRKLLKKIKEMFRTRKLKQGKKQKPVDDFLIRVQQTHSVVKEIYAHSSGLKAISKTLRDPKKTQESCKKTFDIVSQGIEKKYGLKVKFVEPTVVQIMTTVPGNYATYDIKNKTIIMEKIQHPKDIKQIDWYHMLRELRHEYGYFLLLEKYGGRANFPDIGAIRITKMLDDMHD